MQYFAYLTHSIVALVLYLGAASAAQAVTYASVVLCGGGVSFTMTTPFVPTSDFVEDEIGISGCQVDVVGFMPIKGPEIEDRKDSIYGALKERSAEAEFDLDTTLEILFSTPLLEGRRGAFIENI